MRVGDLGSGTCLKQRKRQALAEAIFSAVPVVNAITRENALRVLRRGDTSSVVLECWKDRIFEPFARSPTPMTNGMLEMPWEPGQEADRKALDSLQKEGRSTRMECERPFGVGGARIREVAAWRPVVRLNVVDAAQIMVKQRIARAQQYNIIHNHRAHHLLTSQTIVSYALLEAVRDPEFRQFCLDCIANARLYGTQLPEQLEAV